MKIFITLGLTLSTFLSIQACKTTSSDVKASNQFGDIQTKYWYETLHFGADSSLSGDFEFAQYHKNHKDKLLGNANGDLLPDSLKGLWYMDGNPLPDQTLQFNKVVVSERYKKDSRFEGQHILLKVGDPMTFSWANVSKSHDLNGKIIKYKYEYELAFLDCPADVVKERREKWGMSKPGCTAEDREYAVITPHVSWRFISGGVPKFLANFDMYLRPKTSDHLVWERRSKINELAAKMMGADKGDTPPDGWSRYRFTQILDKEGNTLSSYKRFRSEMEVYVAGLDDSEFAAGDLVKARADKLNSLLFYKCPKQSADGCDSPENVEADVTSEFSEEEGSNYLQLPFL